MLIIKEATEMDTQIFNASKQAYTTEFPFLPCKPKKNQKNTNWHLLPLLKESFQWKGMQMDGSKI